MRNTLLMVTVLLAGFHFAFGQYDYDDYDLKKKPKPPPEQKKTPKPDDGKGFDPERLSLGGMFNFSFGGGFYDGITEYSNILYLDISPIVAYQFIENRLDLGAGIIYQLQRYDAYVPAVNYRYDNTSHTYGGRIFPRVYIFEGLFAQVEYVLSNTNVYLVDQRGYIVDEARMTFHNAFAGAGYRFPIGGNSYFTLLGSVNLNTNLLYPRRQFFVSFGFGVGL